MWSATLTDEIIEYARRYMRNPREVLLSKDDVAQPLVDQYYLRVEPELKVQALIDLLGDRGIDQAIIFCNTRESTDEVTERLTEAGVPVEALHGRYSQSRRDEIMSAFKLGSLRYIVATDVAARGLDIQGVSHIINYEVPHDAEVYFHRVGRTGRMEQTGVSVTLVGNDEAAYFDEIAAMTKLEIKEIGPRGLASPAGPQ